METKFTHRAIGLLLILAGIVLCLSEVLAEPRLIRVNGLSFFCPGCVQVNETDCQVLHGGEPMRVACSEIVDYLISQAGLTRSMYPTHSEIVAYLIKNKIEYRRARQLFWLLMRDEKGQDEFLFNVSRFSRLYPETIEELINEGWGNPEILNALWDILGPENNNDSMGLRAVIAVQSPDKDLSDLVDRLSVTNLVGDQLALKSVEDKLRMLGSTWAADIEDLRKLLVSCSEAGFDTSSSLCSAAHIAQLDEALQIYLKRVQVQQVLARIADTSIPARERLTLLATTPYDDFRTPEMHRALHTILSEVERGKSEIDWEEVRDNEVGEMLSAFALDDPTLMNAMGRLISLDELRKKRRKADKQDYERAMMILPAVKSGAASPGISWVPIMAILVVLCSLSAAIFAWRRFSVVEADEPLGTQTLTPVQFSELGTLQLYFGLDERASADEVKKRYRTMARKLHPDVDGGTAEAFAELNDNYKRALELLGASADSID